ncbi:hypothetical protein N0V90_008103 [Kalmusia sp. IMI 367209]|nr:hypothetical protein N0V90_008103 [Kalmusia sp. IMI 367209]
MDLYYFPVTANVSRDMCADGPTEGSATRTPDPDSTYTEVTTGLSTVVNGLTMWEGNVYLSLTEPFVQDSCGNTIEPQVKKPRVITMASSDLFSVRGYPHNVIPFSMNYADLNDPTPWSAYVGGWYCANNRPICSEVFPNEYYPVMSMPGQIRQLDPNWASCDFDQYGIFDPPIALHGVPNFLTSSSAAADPTQTSAEPVVSETASPGQTSNGGPSATSAPEPTNMPSDPEDPSSSTGPGDPASSDPSTPTDPQDPTASADPQDPTPSDPSTPTDPQDPTPSNTQVPSDPQESIPTDPQDPTPSDPQVTASGDPQNPAPTDPSNTAPSDPQNPTPSDPQTPPNDPQDPSGSQSQGPGNTQSPAPNDPQSPAPGNTQAPSPNDPQSPAPGNTQNPATNPNGNPTGTVGNSPSNPTPPAITVGPTVIPVDPTGGVIINPGTTLSSGGAPVVISSSTFNIGTGGLTIVSPETSTEIPFETTPVTVPVGPGSTPVILDPAGSTVVLGGTTLTQGGEPVTVGGITLSVGSSGVVVVGPSGTSTIAIPTADSTTPQVVTVGSAQLTVTDGSVVLAPGTSLGVGDPAVTISDTVFSVGSTGLIVVGSGRTSTIPVTGLVSSSADATAADATRTGTETGSSATPSETGGAEFPGAAGRISWSTGSIIGVALGVMGVVIL